VVDGAMRGAARVAGDVACEVWGCDGDEPLASHVGVAETIAAINGIYEDELALRCGRGAVGRVRLATTPSTFWCTTRLASPYRC
jgi:hypothetical protein